MSQLSPAAIAHDSQLFSGEERLEVLPILGRVTRKGSTRDLKQSDIDRLRKLLQDKDAAQATSLLNLLHEQYTGMVTIYTEWSLAWSGTVAKAGAPCDERKSTALALKLLSETLNAEKDFSTHPYTKEFLKVFSLDRYKPTLLNTYRGELLKGIPALVTEMQTIPNRHHATLLGQIQSGAFDEASRLLHQYLAESRLRHDLLVELVSCYPAALDSLYGQEVASKILRESFTGGIIYAGLWGLVKSMTPIEVASFLAEHLRAHLSGVARDGAVEIVEETDRYRLIFAPCGSGQAMRQRSQLLAQPSASATVTKEGSPMNWGRAGEVPHYCTHCAVNELESFKHLAYPVFMTEFDPDPKKPCGWTIYKDPKQIPQKYFDRIGVPRDPSKFVPIGK